MKRSSRIKKKREKETEITKFSFKEVFLSEEEKNRATLDSLFVERKPQKTVTRSFCSSRPSNKTLAIKRKYFVLSFFQRFSRFV
jgi:hypothetical protein